MDAVKKVVGFDWELNLMMLYPICLKQSNDTDNYVTGFSVFNN